MIMIKKKCKEFKNEKIYSLTFWWYKILNILPSWLTKKNMSTLCSHKDSGHLILDHHWRLLVMFCHPDKKEDINLPTLHPYIVFGHLQWETLKRVDDDSMSKKPRFVSSFATCLYKYTMHMKAPLFLSVAFHIDLRQQRPTKHVALMSFHLIRSQCSQTPSRQLLTDENFGMVSDAFEP